MNRDEMIQKVAEALDDEADVWQLARMAVEALEQAGAFDVTLLLAQEAGLAESEVGSADDVWIPKTNWKQRAEQAESNVEHWKKQASLKADQARAERALADRLAEALKEAWTHEMDSEDYEAALADWETRRK